MSGYQLLDEPAADVEPRYNGHARVLPFEGIGELCARVDAMGPRRYLIRGIWPAGAYGVHAAEPKAGKTWNGFDLVVAVASGQPWLGHFPIDTVGPVVVFAGEGGAGNVVRRLRAIATRMGVVLEDLPITVCCRAPHLNNALHAREIADKLADVRPVLVVLDPLYLSARGVSSASLIDMGALLEGPQRACEAVGASLVVVTHFNRKEGRGAARITGAGPAEWGRVLMSAAVLSRRTDPLTRKTTVVLEVDVVGGEVPDSTFKMLRSVLADDPDDLDSALHYSVEVLPAVTESDNRDDGLAPADRAVLATLHNSAEPQTTAQLQKVIGDARVAAGQQALTRQTISKSLNSLADLGLVNEVDQGPGLSKFWAMKGCA